MLFFEASQFAQQLGNVVSDDAPQGVVVNAKVAVNQPISRGDDEPPLNLRIRCTYIVRNMCCGLSYQFEVAHRSVIVQLLATNTV